MIVNARQRKYSIEEKNLKLSINVTLKWIAFVIFIPSTFLRYLSSVCKSETFRVPHLDIVQTPHYWHAQCLTNLFSL